MTPIAGQEHEKSTNRVRKLNLLSFFYKSLISRNLMDKSIIYPFKDILCNFPL